MNLGQVFVRGLTPSQCLMPTFAALAVTNAGGIRTMVGLVSHCLTNTRL